MSALDRRDFLQTAGPLALVSLTGQAAPPPIPKAKGGEGLKPLPGDSELALTTGVTRRLGTTRMRLPGYVNRLAFSPKGTTLVAASGNELRGWDPKTGKVLFRVAYPADSNVDSGRLTSKDTFTLLVRSNSGGQIRVCHYEFGSGKLIAATPPITMGQAQSTAYSIDGSLMAVAQQDGLALFDCETGTQKWKEAIRSESTSGCWFMDDLSTIVLAHKGSLTLHDVASGKVTGTLKYEVPPPKEKNGKPADETDSDWVRNPLASPDGKWIAASVGDLAKTVCCWDVKAAKLRHTFKPAAKVIGFHKAGTELLTYYQGVATFWNLLDGKSRSFDVPADDDMALSPDGAILAATADDSAILIDAKTGKHLAHSADPPGLPDRLRSFGNTLSGRMTQWGGWTEWNLRDGTSRTIRPMNVSGFIPIAMSRDGKTAVYQKESNFDLRDVATGSVLVSSKSDGIAKEAWGATTSPDGRTLIVWRAEELIAVQAGETKSRKIPRPGVTGMNAAISVAESGRLVAVGINNNGGRGAVDIFDLFEFRFVRRYETAGDVNQIAWSPDGAWLAIAHAGENPQGRFGQNGSATVFDLSTGKATLKVPEDNQREQCIAISPDGRMFARLEAENKIAVWEVLSGSLRRRMDAGGAVASLAFTADGKTLAASVRGAPIFLWDLHVAGWRLPVSKAALDRAWADLRSPDAAVAFAAIRFFSTCPKDAIPFLKECAVPVVAPEAEKIRLWIEDLDHRDFRKRESAMKSLAALGERSRGSLRDALGKTLPPETRERIERLLAADDRPTPEQLRLIRSVEAMEVVGTPEAVGLLAHWSTGAAGATFTRASADAKKRLAILGTR